MVEKSGRPGYLQLADDLRDQIRTGALIPGAALPSTARLGEHYGVSASVVKAAITVLRLENLVVGQQGKGVFVREGAAELAEEPNPLVIMEQIALLRESLAAFAYRIDSLEAAVFRDHAE